jgi:hypothetical protein
MRLGKLSDDICNCLDSEITILGTEEKKINFRWYSTVTALMSECVITACPFAWFCIILNSIINEYLAILYCFMSIQHILSQFLDGQTKTNSVTLSLQANYTDWATATCRRNLVPTFVDRGVSPGQRGGSTTVVNLIFLNRSRYFCFK